MPKRKKQLSTHTREVTVTIPLIFQKRCVRKILAKKLWLFGKELITITASNLKSISALLIKTRPRNHGRFFASVQHLMHSYQSPVKKGLIARKNRLRQLAKLCPCFEKVKSLFQLIFDYEAFDFPMLSEYGFVHK